MKINYEDIMARAVTRCAELKDFTDYAVHAQQMADELLYAAHYFANLRNKMRSLDLEAQAMLGDAGSRLDEVGKTLSNLTAVLTAEKSAPTESKTWASLAKLLEALK